MKHVLLIILLLLNFRLYGTHIVGGEIEMIHLDSTRYRINLIQYFDVVNGQPEAEDPNITLYIFRKSDNLIVRSLFLLNRGSTIVPYTSINCTIDELITRRIEYSTEVILEPQLYSDPGGYYMVWERCCRNEVITNIRNPGAVGQAFYLEFPPLTQNGQRLINSSPILFPPLSDYACVNDFYYADFSGYDPDGDSLVYSIVQPLAGFSSPSPDNIIPPPSPAPYPVIQWISGITTRNSIPGRPPLDISHDGLLTVKPSESGLFVFSVQCEEYRNGKRIGEVRRDFQMLVIDCPDPGNQPELRVRTPGSDAFTDNPDTLVFTVEEEKCYEFRVKDADGAGKLNFRVMPVNFDADLDEFLTVTSGELKGPDDYFTFEFCFPECPFLADQPQVVDIIAGDDACPLPLLDTIRLVAYIEPPPNSRPSFDTLANSIIYDLDEGNFIHLSLSGSDPDGDSLLFSVITPESQPDYDFDFSPEFPSPENMWLDFSWEASCKKYDFSRHQNFSFFLLLDDNDFCHIYSPDTLVMNIHVDLPPNQPPVIQSDVIQQPVTLKILDSLVVEIEANDPDNDPMWVYAVPDQFDLAANGFTPFNHQAEGSLKAPFGWKLDCETLDLDLRDEFLVRFVAEDIDRCEVAQADTLELLFRALPPDNLAPSIHLVSHEEPGIELIAGDSLYILADGSDPDSDSVFIFIDDPSGRLEENGAIFNTTKGSGSASASIFWQTDCSHLPEGGEPALFGCRLIISDNKCLVPMADTLDLTISLKNREVSYDDLFIPNVFTPNADGFNDYFTIDDLPEDNCDHEFQSVSIYNRVGKEVFYTKERQFRWYAGNVKNGIYYYHIKYSGRDYKGYLHVLY